MNKMLEKNFKESEFDCKCKCGIKIKIDTRLITALQEIRDFCGEPVYINSGLRCPAHNKAVGGSPHSKHMSGEAADIRITGADSKTLAYIIRKLCPDMQVYVYPTFCHIETKR